MASLTEDELKVALAWLTTPIRCGRRCPDCHGSSCGITPEDNPWMFTAPLEIEHAVAFVREQLERDYKESIASSVIAEEGEMTDAEICEWLGTAVPCEKDCPGGCGGAGCGYTREDRIYYLKDVPAAVRAYLDKKWEEEYEYEREREEEYEAWKERYIEEREGW
jgi:hypothetical protein